MFYRTETALVKVIKDLFTASVKRLVFLFVLLDPCAASDTILLQLYLSIAPDETDQLVESLKHILRTLKTLDDQQPSVTKLRRN